MDSVIYKRMQQRNDVEENWNKATNFIPLMGEIIVYNPDQNHSNTRFKIGDGKNFLKDLPFQEDKTFSITEDDINSICS